MCHKIRTNIGFGFGDCEAVGWKSVDVYLLGFKRMTYEKVGNSTIFTSIFRIVDYNVRKLKHGYKFTCDNPVKRQEIEFQIDLVSSGNMPVTGVVKAGIHISPISIIKQNDNVLHTQPFVNKTEELFLLVAFKPEDIVFFDGHDVSVRKFYVLNPEKVRYVHDNNLVSLIEESYNAVNSIINNK